MSLSAPIFYPVGFNKSLVNDGKNYDETADPKVDPRSLLPGDAIDDSTGTGVASDGQATNLTDNDIRAQLIFDPADSDTDELLEMEMSLTNRDTYDFGFLGLHNIRDAFPAAVNQQVDFLHHTSADIANATAITPNTMTSGFLGQLRSFFRFDGVDDIGTVSDAPELDAGFGDLSIEALVRFRSVPAAGVSAICSRFTDASNRFYFRLDTSQSLFQFLFRVGGTTLHFADFTFVPVVNQLYHIVGTIENGVATNVYVDAVDQTLSTETNTGGQLSLNEALDMAEYDTDFADIDLKVLRLWNRKLSQAEVTTQEAAPFTVPSADVDASETYTSDFSADVDGWTATKGTAAGNIDGIGGKNNVLRFTIDGTAGAHSLDKASLFTNAVKNNASLEYFIPSANTDIDGIALGGGFAAQPNQTVTDAWTAVKISNETAVGTLLQAFALKAGSSSFTGNSADVFYLRTVLTGRSGAIGNWTPDGINPDDGKWYDSANALHATITGAIAIDTPTGTDYGFTLALFDEASDQFWFARTNEDALTASENVRLGQWAMGKSFTPTFNPDVNWTEEIGVKGTVTRRTTGGRFMSNRRHGKKLRFIYQWTFISEADKAAFDAFDDTVGEDQFPFLFTPNSDDAEPRYYWVRKMSNDSFTGLSADAYGYTMVLEED